MNNVTFVGNLAADPELIMGDKPRARFRVAVNEGQGDTEKTHFVDVTAFDSLAENIVETLGRGMRVVVVGRLNTYKSDVEIRGEEKSITRVAFTATAVGPELRFATAKVRKVAKKSDDDDERGSSHGSGRGNGKTRDDDEDGGKRSGSGSGSRKSQRSDDEDDF